MIGKILWYGLILLVAVVFMIQYQEYGYLQEVEVRITEHQVIMVNERLDGIITLCDPHDHCGNLTVVSRWQHSNADLERFLNRAFPLNSTFNWFQYEKRPEVYLSANGPQWMFSMLFLIPLMICLGFLL